ncbi:hypothetical protein GCM10027275_39940 [Rhabdobacter roseus]|uniref:histidine kinase n=1 Tax=Rhabdobacter roseus TaxID=1655419 RepID=A0A840TPK1_9BACT|nr:ATP-binding protein [Rhabdobacter roseus]MBB5285701.1 signal transduction histidine kinase [Rhabdobacter roseus]
MKAAYLPSNEEERLNALFGYQILDTLPEQDFDDITRIASEICQTTISLISLVDKDRQWFKAKQGPIEDPETPREQSFCAHAILNPLEVMIVPDTAQDERFFDNPHTIGFPYVRFYAGVPLVTYDGYALGSLCVIDQVPRELSPTQIEALRALSKQVISQFELRKKAKELEEIQLKLVAMNYELHLAKQKAEETDQAKSAFLSVMSHEIRNPLHAVLGYTTLLLEEDPRDDQLPSLKVLKFSGETLLALVNDILDINKLDAGKVVLEEIPFSLRELLENSVRANMHRARERDNTLECHYDESIPEQVLGDPVRLLQVVTNLLSNAVKFTENGRVTISAKVLRQNPSEVALLLRVSDTGIGIPAHALGTIFEEFAQASTAINREFGGTGLGLSITQKILALYDSKIQVESQLGVGTTFSFELTLRKALPATTQAMALEEVDLSGYKVLVVDDTEMNLKLLGHNLRKKGMDVATFSSPFEGLEAALSQAYDIVLLDLQMPGMTGFELSRRIREAELQVPIIALSGDNSLETARLVQDSGMNGFLSKPYVMSHLYQLLVLNLVLS